MKKETLEEAAENYANKKGHIPTTELEDAIFKQGFLDGANWQQERMYSEEDLRNAFKAGREGDMVFNNESPKYWDFDTYLQSLLTTTT
jgi:hypothetical protein